MNAEHLEDAFASIIGPGVKLSIALYHFASPLGSAGEDMKDVGAEVTLFCATMRQVRATFNSPKSFRVSTTALHDVHDVLSRGKSLFDKIRVLLEKLQSSNDSYGNLYARVKDTFGKSKVLMWKESLRSCTAMVQVMLTTMAFAERIGGARGDSEPNEDDQLRDLMQSLLLAQQSTNARLERLENQTLLEEMERTEASTSPNNLAPDSLAQKRHRRNRSSRAIFDISADGAADLLAENSQRTSVLLNRKIFQEDDFTESQRRTWNSFDDYRHSVAQSNDLLQTWTDQLDPAPPYMLSFHGEYGSDAYMRSKLQHDLEEYEEQQTLHSLTESLPVLDSSITEDETSAENQRRATGIQTLRTSDNEHPSSSSQEATDLATTTATATSSEDTQHDAPDTGLPSPPTVGSSSMTKREAYLRMTYSIRRALLLVQPAFVYALHSYTSEDDAIHNLSPGDVIQVISQLDTGWWDGVLDGTRAWFPSNFCDILPDSNQASNDSLNGPQAERELLDDEDDTMDSDVEKTMTVETSPSLSSELFTMTGSKIPQVHSLPSVRRYEQTSAQPPNMQPPVEIFKSFRVAEDDPCWKVLPLAVRTYKLQNDWRNYALYIIHGDQERCVGLEERPLMLFNQLSKSGRKPTFMLRKVATPPEAFVDAKLPGSLDSAMAESKITSEPPSVKIDEAVGEDSDERANVVDDAVSESKNKAISVSSAAKPNIPAAQLPGLSSSNQQPTSEASLKPSSAAAEIFKSLRVSMDDPCRKVLPAALSRYNIRADWTNYALWIVYGNEERCFGLDEKPLLIFKELDRAGKKPMFMLRKKPMPATTNPGADSISSLETKSAKGDAMSGSSLPGPEVYLPPPLPAFLPTDQEALERLALKLKSGAGIDFPFYATALYACTDDRVGPGQVRVLHFEKGETLDIHHNNTEFGGWWLTAKNRRGDVGLVPTGYFPHLQLKSI